MEVVISESRWCLFLDVDGTLLELAATPGSVHVDSALQDLLSRVSFALHGAVALISGRPIADIDRLFSPRRWPAAGVHGLERRDSGGRWHARNAVDTATVEAARRRLLELSTRLPGTLLEDKGVALALHYRQAPHAEEQLRREARAIVRSVGGKFRLLEGRMVLELRPDGATKAVAVREFMDEAPFKGRRPIFVGDDLTDEEALVEVERMGGLSVAVGDRVFGKLRVSGPRDVRVFLEELAERRGPAE